MKPKLRNILLLSNLIFVNILLFSISVSFELHSKEIIKVSLEPLPPLVVDNKNGLTIELLKRVELISNFKFDIVVRPYSRAKKELRDGKTDLMGHTPHKKEEILFYKYAQELDWSAPTKIDIYSKKRKNLDLKRYKDLTKIGTPFGNKEFLSELLDIPLSHFHEGKIENLLKMLKVGRIDAFLFERASTQTSIQKLKYKGIYYQEITDVPVGLAVQKNKEGSKLKKRLDKVIKKVKKHVNYSSYLKYTKLPSFGLVKVQP